MFTIEPGSMSDHDALAAFHYRSGPPATRCLVLRAMAGGTLAGVLVVSSPALNGPWRSIAWPSTFSSVGKREVAARLNREVRCISRVIVDPRFRGLGVAGSLVRAYLADPLTRKTEAVSCMGAFCPFFERAGMRPIPVPPSRAAARLAKLLSARRVRSLDLIDRRRCRRVLDRHPEVSTMLRRWANDSRSLRRLATRTSDESLGALAAATLISRRFAYVAEQSSPPDRCDAPAI